jgi:hypothetical protein
LDNHLTAIFGNEPTHFSLALGVRVVSIATTINKSRIAHCSRVLDLGNDCDSYDKQPKSRNDE